MEKFEEQFPSLEGKENAKIMIRDSGISFMHKESRDCHLYTEFDIQKHCFDKTIPINLTVEEMSGLIVRGETILKNEVKITAVYPTDNKIYGIIKERKTELEQYKEKVREVTGDFETFKLDRKEARKIIEKKINKPIVNEILFKEFCDYIEGVVNKVAIEFKNELGLE